jgi:hypothetical protein
MSGKDDIAGYFGELLRSEASEEVFSEDQREAVVEMAIEGPARWRRLQKIRWIARGGAIAAAAVICLIVHTVTQGPDRLDFQVGDPPVKAEEGHWVRTGANENTFIRFTGGTRFDFVEKTKARVVEVRTEKVTIDLEQGQLFAEVTPNQSTAWSVRAGPYVVTVRGTKFSVHWSDSRSELTVAVNRGKVLVRGPGIEEAGVMLAAGRSLRAEATASRVTFEPIRLASRALELETPSFLEKPLSEGIPASAKNEIIPEKIKEIREADHQPLERESRQSWRRLYKAKDFKGALDLAVQEGLTNLKKQLGEEDLWKLANAARYARENRVAKELLSTYRSRFSSTNRSRTAAFLLGKNALDTGTPHDAKRWFEMYLAEAPQGPLAEEALGRLFDIYTRLGLTHQAEQAADTYLRKHDGGYFTKQAQQAAGR